MKIAKVTGTVVSTIKYDRYRGFKLLKIRHLTLDGEDVSYQCRATLEYRTEQGGESYSITLMESMLSSYLPPISSR